MYEYLFPLLIKSIGLSSAVASFSTLIGGILAFVLTKTDMRLKAAFKLATLLPLFLPPYIFTVAWVDLLVMLHLKTKLIFSYFGAFFIMTLVFTPLSVLIISTGLSNISSSLEESALMFAGSFTALKKIVLPLLRPTLVSSFMLVFILAISEFSIASFLSLKVFTTEIFTQFAAFYNHKEAIILSLVIVGICLSLLFFEGTYLTNAPFISIGLKAKQELRIIKLSFYKPLVELCFFLYILFSTLLPIIVLFIQVSFKIDVFLKAINLLKPTILFSLYYALLGALILCLLGFLIAFHWPNKVSRFIEKLIFLSFAIPSTVLGILLIKIFNHKELSLIYSSFFMIILVYVFKFLFISEKLILNTIKQFPASLIESATILGASKKDIILRIIGPLSFRAIFASFVICFIFCISELGGTILVYPPGTSLMPIKVFTIMANAPQSLISAMCATILLITSGAVIFMFFIKFLLEKISRKAGWKLYS